MSLAFVACLCLRGVPSPVPYQEGESTPERKHFDRLSTDVMVDTSSD